MAKILLVDDEKSIRITFSKFLGNAGFEVIPAENVDKALEIIEKNEPDVVVTDIIMPHYTGMDLLQKIKEKALDIPVIIMTGEPSIDTATFSLRYKAYDYLQKPVNKSDLVHTVEKALEYKRLVNEKMQLETENENYRNNLEKLVEKRTNELTEAVTGSIQTISSMLRLRDPYTADHDTKVGNLAGAIAKKMKLSKKRQQTLIVAGYLHDIGKIAVPSEILSKPGRLTDIEYEIVKGHVKNSYDILSAAKLPWNIDELVFNHHERLDGSGYPRQVKGDDLNLESRILIISDVAEAILSHRPYRPALEYSVLLDELKKNEGRAYDQDVAAVVNELFSTDGYKLENKNMEFEFFIDNE
ncbi:MAG TPA: response regulator [Clostridia bacterium]|nr:response regulator [Clostridia bacterium]HPQ47743.1 response regulator [Clostridia bacterium]